MKKKILIITLSDLRYDARVRRQVQALNQTYDIWLAGFNGEPSSADYRLIPIVPTKLTLWRKMMAGVLLITRRFIAAHNVLYNYTPVIRQHTEGETFDMILANDIETLPIAFDLTDKNKIFYDAHEYAPRHFEDKLSWRIFFKRFNMWLCSRFLHRTGAMTTVSNGLARAYEMNYGVKPVVIPNANDYFDHRPSDVDEYSLRLVHVGIANPSRKLELMIQMMSDLDDRFTLDMYLLVPGFASQATRKYIRFLENSIADSKKIRILPPIKSAEVVKVINTYDIGVFLLPPINFNYENTLPNKLFDFIQARLAVAIGPTPEMAEVVKRFDLGVVSENFTPHSLAVALNSINASDVRRFKENAGNAATAFNAQKNAIQIRRLVKQVIDG